MIECTLEKPKTIKSFNEVEIPSNVTDLNLTDVLVKDLSGLTQFKNLESLQIKKNFQALSDVNLPNLKELFVNSRAVSDLSFLAHFSSLKKIRVGDRGSLVSNLEPISQLLSLEELFVDTAQVSDLTPLKNSIQLRSIHLVSNKSLQSVKGLEKLINLEELDLNLTSTSDLTPLSGLTSLKKLYLRGSKVKSLEGVVLPNLEYLYLEKSRLNSLKNIESFPKLKLFWFWDTRVKDVNPIFSSTNLENLDLTEFTEVDLSQIENLTQLKEIDLFRTQVKLPFTLKNDHLSLEKLRVTESNITDFSFLQKLPHLKSFDAFNSHFSDEYIDLLCNLPQLEYVSIGNTKVTQQSEKLTELQKILKKRDGGIYSRDYYKFYWEGLVE